MIDESMIFDLKAVSECDALDSTPYSRGCFNGTRLRKGLNKSKSRKLNKLARKARKKNRN